MTEDQRAFWGAVVQIIPVLLLALAVVARYLRLARKDVKRFWAATHAELQAIVSGGNTKGAYRKLLGATAKAQKFLLRRWTSPMLMLACVALLTVAEVAGLVALGGGSDIGATWRALAIAAILIGTLEVAVVPVFQRSALIMGTTIPRPADLRRIAKQAEGSGPSDGSPAP